MRFVAHKTTKKVQPRVEWPGQTTNPKSKHPHGPDVKTRTSSQIDGSPSAEIALRRPFGHHYNEADTLAGQSITQPPNFRIVSHNYCRYYLNSNIILALFANVSGEVLLSHLQLVCRQGQDSLPHSRDRRPTLPISTYCTGQNFSVLYCTVQNWHAAML